MATPTAASREQELIKRTREQIEKRTGKTPEQLYAEREKRIVDAINLKEPDRVPVHMRGVYFPTRYSGLPESAVFYDSVAYKEAVIKTLLDFDPDCVTVTANIGDGPAMEALDLKQYLWPGGPIRSDQVHQFIDAEIMKEDEYDIFLTDPTDFMIRFYLPRRFGALESFSKLPPLGQGLGGSVPGFLGMTRTFTGSGFQKAVNAVEKAGHEEAKLGRWAEEVSGLGFPPVTYAGGVAGAPLDWVGDYLRGMNGMMIDMFKRPEKLLAACEKILEWRIARAAPAGPKEKGRRVGGGANHWIAEAFLSKKQFETFVWPTYKKALMTSIDLGFVPSPFLEGKNDDRIEYYLELPKGKVFPRFEVIDIFRAKEILGGHCCIAGGVPAALLWAGSPQEVEEYCEKLIKVCGKGGGFILASACGLDDAKPANVKVMMDSVKKYGRY